MEFTRVEKRAVLCPDEQTGFIDLYAIDFTLLRVEVFDALRLELIPRTLLEIEVLPFAFVEPLNEQVLSITQGQEL